MTFTLFIAFIAVYIISRFRQPGPRLVSFFAGVGILCLIVGLIDLKKFLFFNHYAVQTNCTVVKVIPQPQDGQLACIKVLLSYKIADSNYQTIYKPSCVSQASDLPSLLAEYPISQVRQCWINTDDHSDINFAKKSFPFVELLTILAGLYLINYRYNFFRLNKQNENESTNNKNEIHANTISDKKSNKSSLATKISRVEGKIVAEAPIFSYIKTAQLNPINSGLLCIVIGVIFVFVGKNMVEQEWDVNHRFLQADCLIVNSKINSSLSGDTTLYSASFLLHYTVNNKTYNDWHHKTIMQPSTSFYRSVENDLQQFKINNHYPCWYNPNEPQIVVLNKSYSWISWLICGVGLITLFLGLFQVLRIYLKSSK